MSDFYYTKIDRDFEWRRGADVYTGGQEGQLVALGPDGVIAVGFLPSLIGSTGPPGPPGPAGTPVAAGTPTQLQYNAAGVFAASSELTYEPYGLWSGVGRKRFLVRSGYIFIDHGIFTALGGETLGGYVLTGVGSAAVLVDHYRPINILTKTAGTLSCDAVAVSVTNNGTPKEFNALGTAEVGGLIGEANLFHGGDSFGYDWIAHVPAPGTDDTQGGFSDKGGYSITVGGQHQLDRHVLGLNANDSYGILMGYDRGFVVTNIGSVIGQGQGFMVDGYAIGFQVTHGVGGDCPEPIVIVANAADTNLLHATRAAATDMILGTFGQAFIVKTGNPGFSGRGDLLVDGFVGVRNHSPTATLHLGAGFAGPTGAPLKLTAGTNLTATEDGAFEYDGTHLYFTIGAVRNTLI